MTAFYDYACPYCLRGHQSLVEQIGNYPDIEIEWKPCEAHPEPEPGPHSGLLVHGFAFAQEHGVDVWKYHEKAYAACLKDRINYESVETLANYFQEILDKDAFIKEVGSGKYKSVQDGNNDLAYEQSGVWAVPAFRMNGNKLDAVEGIGVSPSKLKDFLENA
jgi:predicted DsbA family dithiol-disulfide isomerase